MNATLFPNLPAEPVDVILTAAEVAQVRYKLWKIQKLGKSDTTLYNQARHLQQLIGKAERRALRERKRGILKR